MDNQKVIKVLVTLNDKGGSNFHRLKYPLSKINNTEIDNHLIEVTFREEPFQDFTEIEQYNILIYNWSTFIPNQEINKLQAKGVKIIYSIDDFWQFSDDHPYYNNPVQVAVAQNMVIRNLLIADAVMTTTERLTINCLKYNDNIAIIPNFLNSEDFKIEKKPSDKLRIGIIGSISHIPDWKLLKPVINRLAKSKEIVENCEFHICGYMPNKKWDEVKKMFEVKKNISLFIHNGVSVDDYMKLYENLDVCLLPLEYTEFNACKSALKLEECRITNTLPLGSLVYTSKELKGIVVAETPYQYEQSILELLDKDYYKQVLEYVTKVNESHSDFNKRIENTKSLLYTVYLDDLSIKLDNLEMYSVTYDKNQIPEYKNYDNSAIKTKEQKSWRFEYNPMIDIVSKIETDEEDYLGILSYKFNEKTGIPKNILLKTLKKKKYQNYDFINLAQKYWKTTKDYLKFGYDYHQNLEPLVKRVLEKLNVPYEYNKDDYTYSNFFIMKKKFWKDYVDNWVVPALEFMENDPEYFENAKYFAGLTPEKLKELTELDHYTYHTFILERLICFFIKNRNLNATSIV